MASSIILHQSGDSRYEDSGEKLNNKAGCDIAAFGGRGYSQGSSKKGLVPAAANFLRILEAANKELYTGQIYSIRLTYIQRQTKCSR